MTGNSAAPSTMDTKDDTSPAEPNFDMEESPSRTTNPADQFLKKTATTHTLSGARANFFTFFIVLTQLVQMMPYGVGINAGSTIAPQLGSSPQLGAWIAASYPLTQGSFVLIGGTLGSVYGHKNMLALGSAWWIFWTLATGLMDNLVGFSVMRGLSGMGGGLMVPNQVALLGITFPPGRRKNLAMALFGAMAPVGASGGSLVAAAFVQEVQWKWLFLFM